MAGRYNTKVPLMMGTNRDEAHTFIYGAEPIPLPVSVWEIAVKAAYPQYAQEVLDRYRNASITDGRWLLGNTQTDQGWRCASQLWGLAHARAAQAPAYFYLFSKILKDGQKVTKFDLPIICAQAVCHATELVFVFHADLKAINASITPDEEALADSFVDYWSSFARTSNPNNARQPVTWPAYDPTNRNILRLDTPIRQQSDANLCNFWDKVGYSTRLQAPAHD